MGYRSTRELTVAEAAYIAGLVDGEGTVTLSRRHANERRQLVVTIANTERQLPEFVQMAAGTGKITRKRTAAERHTPRNGRYTQSQLEAREAFEQAFLTADAANSRVDFSPPGASRWIVGSDMERSSGPAPGGTNWWRRRDS